MALAMRYNANSAHVASTSYHCNHTGVKPDKVGNFAVFKTDLDGIVDFDSRVRVSDPMFTYPSVHWDRITAKTWSNG